MTPGDLDPRQQGIVTWTESPDPEPHRHARSTSFAAAPARDTTSAADSGHSEAHAADSGTLPADSGIGPAPAADSGMGEAQDADSGTGDALPADGGSDSATPPSAPEPVTPEPSAPGDADASTPTTPEPTSPSTPEPSSPTPPVEPTPEPSSDAGSPEPDAKLVRIYISDAPTATLPEQVAQPFSISEVRELYVYTQRPALTGQHREIRKYYAPNGDLYYQKLTAFSTELDAPIPFTDRVTIPHSRQVAALQLDDHQRSLFEDIFPVAGTWISDRGMTGAWKLEVYLDDARSPDSTLTFEMVP